jgi:hypothetical protein
MRPPARDISLQWLHLEGFDQQHQRREGQIIGEQSIWKSKPLGHASSSTTSTIFHNSDSPELIAARNGAKT